MVKRQFEQAKCVVGGKRQDANHHVLHCLADAVRWHSEFAKRVLDGNLSKRDGTEFANIVRAADCRISTFAQPFGSFDGEDENGSVQQDAHSLAPEEIFYFLVRHRLPPIGIENLNLPAQGPELRLIPLGLLRAYNVHYWHTTPANGYRFSIFDCLN